MKSQITNHKSQTNYYVLILFGVWCLGFGISAAAAAEPLAISPPIIDLLPRNLGNNEIWYIGGESAHPNAEVIIYLQSVRGETLNFAVRTDEKGSWFYTHNAFLKEGKYKSWAQVRVGGALSPPGPEVSFEILHTALRLGPWNVSFEALYAALALILGVLFLSALAFGLYHFRHYHQKSLRLWKEIREAEEEAAKGFATLRKDLKEELEFISKIKMSRELTVEERGREEKLVRDLDYIESRVLKEIGDIGEALP